MKNEQKTVLAFDNGRLDEESPGTAYLRLTPNQLNLLTRCIEKHHIIGFTYNKGELNFGVILGNNFDNKDVETKPESE